MFRKYPTKPYVYKPGAAKHYIHRLKAMDIEAVLGAGSSNSIACIHLEHVGAVVRKTLTLDEEGWP